jgi:lipid II:glycine glycyltransferase (peptidoglycan interpeptide bridge formation enzyme)
LDQRRWDAAVNTAGGHPMQLWGWGEIKAAHGWSAERLLVGQAGPRAGGDPGPVVGSAQVLYRPLPWPMRSLAYIPRGPQCAPDRAVEVLAAVEDYIKRHHDGVALSIEPDWQDGEGPGHTDWGPLLTKAGWISSDNTILIGRTLILDLTQSEQDLQSQMTSTTRQNIRRAAKTDLQLRLVTTEAELSQVLEVYRQTAARAGFALHGDDYYRDVFTKLGAASSLVAAFDADRAVAFVWLAVSGRTAFELYGGVDQVGQRTRINYGVKWRAIQEMKVRGVERYDFNGLLNDGIASFKKQFGRHENRLVGTWERPLSPLYPVYVRALPLARSGWRRLHDLPVPGHPRGGQLRRLTDPTLCGGHDRHGSRSGATCSTSPCRPSAAP